MAQPCFGHLHCNTCPETTSSGFSDNPAHSESPTRGGVLQSSYTTRITKISEAVDVYSDWIDACEAENPPEQEDAEQ